MQQSAHPLGMAEHRFQPWMQTKLEALAADDLLNRVRDYLASKHRWSPEYADAVHLAFVRFAALHLFKTEYMRPAEDVLTFWKACILHTEEYWTFCIEHLGRVMHYDPSHPAERDACTQYNLYTKTRLYILEIFPEANTNIWKYMSMNEFSACIHT